MILSLFSLQVFSQTPNYQYQIDGSYPAIMPGNLATRNIRFTIEWNERKQGISGIYRDDFFTTSSPVTGTTSVGGRVFQIKLPRIMQNVASLSITSNVNSLTNGNLPLMVFLRDPLAVTISENSISSNVTIRADYVEPATTACDIGFGALSGYCGLYQGSISEVSDSNNLCNLPSYNFRLELNADAKTNVYFYYSDATIGVPSHSLGSFPSAPTSNAVSLSTRHCGPLPATIFSATGCQTLTLTGNYSEVGDGRNFRGSYMITDEETGNSCRYDLNVDREKTY